MENKRVFLILLNNYKLLCNILTFCGFFILFWTIEIIETIYIGGDVFVYVCTVIACSLSMMDNEKDEFFKHFGTRWQLPNSCTGIEPKNLRRFSVPPFSLFSILDSFSSDSCSLLICWVAKESDDSEVQKPLQLVSALITIVNWEWPTA